MFDLFFACYENLILDSMIPIKLIQLLRAISKIFLAFVYSLLSTKKDPKDIKY